MVLLSALSEPPLPAQWEVICGDPLCRFRHSICLLSGENGENEGIGSLHCSEGLPVLFEGGGAADTSSSTYNKQRDLLKMMRFLMTFLFYVQEGH